MSRWDADSTAASSSRFSSTSTVDVENPTPAFLEKLHRKLKQAFMMRGVNGIPHLQRCVKLMDIERERRVDVWEFKKILRDQELKLSDTECEVLFYAHANQHGEVDFDDFLASIREAHLTCTHQQLDDITRRMRQKLMEMDSISLGRKPQALSKLFPGVDLSSDTRLTRMEYERCLRPMRRALHITPSDIVFLFYLFHDDEGRFPVQKLLPYLREPTAEEHMFMMLSKLREAAEDRDRTHSGIVGLSRLLLKAQQGSPLLDNDGFKQGMKNFGCGLLDGEIDTLFEALQQDGRVHINEVVSIIRQQPLVPSSEAEAEALQAKLRKELVTRRAHGMVLFRSMCRKHDRKKRGKLDINELGAAVREMLTASQFRDLDIELLFGYFDADRDQLVDYDEFIRCVRGPIPPVRMDIIEQAWSRVDTSHEGAVPVESFMECFKPNMLPSVQSGHRTEREVLDEVSHHMELETSPVVTKAVFTNYWSNVSPSVEADQEFTLILWNSFQINRLRKTSHQGDRMKAPITLSPTKISPTAQQHERERERDEQLRQNPVTTPGRYPPRHNHPDTHTAPSTPHSEPLQQPALQHQQQQQQPVAQRRHDSPQPAHLQHVSPHHSQPPPPAPNPPSSSANASSPAAVANPRTPPPSGSSPPQQTPPPPSTTSSPPPCPPLPLGSVQRGGYSSPAPSANGSTSSSVARGNRRFTASQGHGGGRSTLNIFSGGGGGDETASLSSARSITGSTRAATAVGQRQLHTQRPF